jgi:hypothetical protein
MAPVLSRMSRHRRSEPRKAMPRVWRAFLTRRDAPCVPYKQTFLLKIYVMVWLP